MFKLDQKGVSLPIVIGVAALILANSYYFLELNRSASKTGAITRSEISEQAEQARIAGALSDLTICASTSNFGGKALASLINTQIPFPISRNGINILELNKSYSQDTHAVSRFHLESDSLISNPQLRYSLIIVYDQARNVPNSISPKKGVAKKTATVKIPMFIETDGSGLITRCYARPTENTIEKQTAVELAVKYACINGSTTTPLVFERSASASSAISECVNNVQELTCGTGQVLNSVAVNISSPTVPGSENRREGTCIGFNRACATTPVLQFVQNIVSSNLTCSDPANGGCSGALMIRNSGNANGFSCSQTCSTTHQLFNSYNANGSANCLNTSTACSISGQYATTVDSNGNVTGCAYVTYRNRWCTSPSTQYATDIDPTTPSDPFKCQSYTKTKDCPGNYNYATSFTSTTIACTGNINY